MVEIEGAPNGELQPPRSPGLKRKRGDSTASPTAVPLGHRDESKAIDTQSPSVSSASVVEINEDLLEDIADQAEMSAQKSELDRLGLTLNRSPASVRARVHQIGIDGFVEELFTTLSLDEKTVGAAFGLNPDIFQDIVDYRSILNTVVVRYLIKRRKLPQYNTIDDVAKLLRESKKIMVITGAGISTSLGIPDFRSKQTGFYAKVQDMGFEDPEEVFYIDVFDENPQIFYSLAGDILPHGNQFTPTHAFIRLIQDKGQLQTNYTQNIDNLEANAGIDPDKVIQCHGSFATASCRKCAHKVPGEAIFDEIRAKTVLQCKECIKRIAEAAQKPQQKPPKRYKSIREQFEDSDSEDDDIAVPGVMKPDITFFGEKLSDNFFDRFIDRDSHDADLVIIIGTSLKVAPVGDMPNHLPENVPHIYISREPCQHINFDVQLLGNCDSVVWELARRAGWDLKHDMIPAGFSVNVEQADENLSHWNIAECTAAECKEASS